jgi:outer membrane protein TolC
MADCELNMLDDFEIIPASKATLETEKLDLPKILEIAMTKNPAIQRARIETEIADININVAKNQYLPRLDLVASARTQALARDVDDAHDRLDTGDYNSYAIGLSLEYPLGNRQRHAELLQKRLERKRAVSALQNTADQVAILAKEGITKIETNYSEIQIQKEAAGAARVHLKALEDSEPVRERLTPEFLFLKLQAQEDLASAQRSEIRAVVEFNIALAQLAQISGTLLELHQVHASLPDVSDNNEL